MEKHNGGMYRVNKYFFGLKFYQLFLSRSLNFISGYTPALQRKIYLDMQPYCGSQWWSIDQYALNCILSFVDQNPQYSAFHKHAFGSDELFFQMILLNSKDERLLKSISNNNIRLILWKSAETSHPKTLKVKDIHTIKSSEALFGRKFDLSEDEQIFNLIDEGCLQN